MKPHAFMFYAVYHSGSVKGGFMSYVYVKYRVEPF